MKSYVLPFLLAILPGCFPGDKKDDHEIQYVYPGKGDRYNTFIQIVLENQPGITMLRNKIKPLIDTIIQEELQVTGDVDFPDFLIPKRHWISRLTLYYLSGLKIDQENYILDALDAMQENQRGIYISRNITLGSQFDFFGGKKEAVVILINDEIKSLFSLNGDIKEFVSNANDQYRTINNEDLFNKKQSEHFPYLPHIEIGRLQIDSLKKFIGVDPHEQEKIIDSIKQRIKGEVFPFLDSLLTSKHRKLNITAFCGLISYIRGVGRSCLKQYELSQK